MENTHNISGQIIAISAKVTLHGGLVTESPNNARNSGLGVILIWQDIFFTHDDMTFLGEFGNPKLKIYIFQKLHIGFLRIGSQEIQTPENHPRTAFFTPLKFNSKFAPESHGGTGFDDPASYWDSITNFRGKLAVKLHGCILNFIWGLSTMAWSAIGSGVPRVELRWPRLVCFWLPKPKRMGPTQNAQREPQKRSSFEQWKTETCLFRVYRGWNATQLCGGLFHKPSY